MEDEVFEAEIMPESGNYVLNITLAATFAVSIIFLMLGTSIGQVLEQKAVEQTNQNWWEVPLQDRASVANLEFVDGRSVLPIKGTYEVLTYTEHFIEVELPLSEEDAGFPEEDKMHVAIWRPNVPDGVKVPVIMSIHPYYDFGGEGMPGVGEDSNPNTIPDRGVGKWIYDNFISHGYALAQASTFGTGQSTHCQDVKGLGEQIGIQAVVDWLGKENWTNGNVGLMGKSYAGTTNWEAAKIHQNTSRQSFQFLAQSVCRKCSIAMGLVNLEQSDMMQHIGRQQVTLLPMNYESARTIYRGLLIHSLPIYGPNMEVLSGMTIGMKEDIFLTFLPITEGVYTSFGECKIGMLTRTMHSLPIN